MKTAKKKSRHIKIDMWVSGAPVGPSRVEPSKRFWELIRIISDFDHEMARRKKKHGKLCVAVDPRAEAALEVAAKLVLNWRTVLRTKWSAEIKQDLKAYYSTSCVPALRRALKSRLKAEVANKKPKRAIK
jgi:hypothetical protein